MKTRTCIASSVIAIVASMASMTSAHAQEAGARPAEGTDDDIIVTARRVDERLQDVPVAVTAIRGDSLQRLGITTTVDLRQAVPSLTVTNAAGRPATPLYSLRGQRGNDQVFTQDPPVAAYLDEVLITPIAGSNGGLFDLESVQVLKGPQGTLFGRNTTGGAILYSSAKPTNEFGGKIEAGYANYDSYRFAGHLNLPISPAAALRIALDYRNQGGFGKVLAGPEAGKETMGFKQFAGRVSLRLNPSDTFENITVAGYSNWKDEGGAAFHILDTPRPTGSANLVFNTNFVVPGNAGLLSNLIAQQRAGGRYDISSGERNGGESKIWTVSNTSTLELSDTLTLKNIFGYRHLDTWDAADYDGTILPILAATNSARANTFSNELQLQGKALDDRLNYIIGAYYFDQSGIEGTGTPFMDVRNQLPGTVAFGGAARLQFVRITNRSISGFAQVGYKLTDTVTLNAGVRYTSDRREAISTTGTVSKTVFNNNHPVVTSCGYTGANGQPLPATFEGCRLGGSKTFSRPSWLLGLDWKADPDTLLYVASRHSYRSGGFQSRPFDNTTAVETFKPETVTDLEFGLKRDWDLGGDTHLRTNLAAYYQWYKNVQRSAVSLTPVGVGNVVRNAAKAHIKGLEIESELRFGQIVRISLNYSYIDPQYDSYPTFIFTNATPPVQVAQDRTAFPFTYIPKHQINGSIALTPDIGDVGELTLQVNAYHQSSTTMGEDYYNAASLSAVIFGAPLPADVFYGPKAYTLVNARAQLDNIGGSGLSAAIWARNLFDKRYVDSGGAFQNSIGMGIGIEGAPRTYGFDLSFKF